MKQISDTLGIDEKVNSSQMFAIYQPTWSGDAKSITICAWEIDALVAALLELKAQVTK